MCDRGDGLRSLTCLRQAGPLLSASYWRISPEFFFRVFAVDRSRLRVAKEVLALVTFTADNHSESRFVSGLLEIFLNWHGICLFRSAWQWP